MDSLILSTLEEERPENPILDTYMTEVESQIEDRIKTVIRESRLLLSPEQINEIITRLGFPFKSPSKGEV